MNEPFLDILRTVLDLVSIGAAVFSAVWLSRLLAPETAAEHDTMTLGVTSDRRDRAMSKGL